LEGVVGKGLTSFNAEEADPDLGVVENRAEELLVRPKASLGRFAHACSPNECGIAE
jgi:hypothetical protein